MKQRFRKYVGGPFDGAREPVIGNDNYLQFQLRAMLWSSETGLPMPTDMNKTPDHLSVYEYERADSAADGVEQVYRFIGTMPREEAEKFIK